MICVLGLFLSACTTNSQVETEVVSEYSIEVAQEIIIPQHYVTYRASQAIKIDGQALEQDWAAADYTTAS